MPEVIVREANETDNAALIELERSCPQGTILPIASERTDYFIRSRFYGGQKILVADDGGRIVGVLAGTLKRLIVNGRELTGALLYDFRLHPDYRRALVGRYMLHIWNGMEEWARDSGADFIYGFVKNDNRIMRGFFERKGYRNAGGMYVVSRPVFKRLKTRYAPSVSTAPTMAEADEFRASYAGRPLFPEPFLRNYFTPDMEDTGIFSYFRIADGDSSAAIGLLRLSETLAMRVIRLPWYYRIAGSLLPALPIPNAGGLIRYQVPFNPVVNGPRSMDLWRDLTAHLNNRALDDGCQLLTSAFSSGDPFLKPWRRGALNTIGYVMGVKNLKDGVPDRFDGFCTDVRDMD